MVSCGRVVGLWHGVSREVVGSPLGAVGRGTEGRGEWGWVGLGISEVFSNPNDPMNSSPISQTNALCWITKALSIVAFGHLSFPRGSYSNRASET